MGVVRRHRSIADSAEAVGRALLPWVDARYAPDMISHRHRAEQIERDAERLYDAATARLFALQASSIERGVRIETLGEARRGLNGRYAPILALTQPLTTFAAGVDAAVASAVRDGDNLVISEMLRRARVLEQELHRFVEDVVSPMSD